MDLSSFVTLLYTTAAYSLVEASENPWSSILKRGNWNFCRVSRSTLHFSQVSASLVGSGSSQSKFKSQSFWKIIFLKHSGIPLDDPQRVVPALVPPGMVHKTFRGFQNTIGNA